MNDISKNEKIVLGIILNKGMIYGREIIRKVPENLKTNIKILNTLNSLLKKRYITASDNLEYADFDNILFAPLSRCLELR